MAPQPRLFDLARMTTATTGTGTITLGSAVAGHVTFATAGVLDGENVAYSISDGTAFESGYGVYSSTGPTLTRPDVRISSNSGAAINLSGNAQIALTPRSTDLCLKLDNDVNLYVRTQPVAVTMTIASPAVVSWTSHGLSVNDPVVFYNPVDRVGMTITIASPGIVTTSAAHGFSANEPMRLQTTGALPTGVVQGTTYYVRATGLTSTQFSLSTTPGGGGINTSGTQSGTHYVVRQSTMPTGVTPGNVYYVIASGFGSNSFQFSASQGGAAVNTSGTQEGPIKAQTGNNNNSGAAATRDQALLSYDQALNKVVGISDAFDAWVTIRIADGHYIVSSTTSFENIMPWRTIELSMYASGGSGNASNCIIEQTGGRSFFVNNRANLFIRGFTLIASGDVQLSVELKSYLHIQPPIIFKLSGDASLISVLNQSQIKIDANGTEKYVIDGSRGSMDRVFNFSAHSHGYIWDPHTWELVNNVDHNVMCQTDYLSTFTVGGITFDGSATGKRYEISNNAVVDSGGGGANLFPGNVAGTTATGGIYN